MIKFILISFLIWRIVLFLPLFASEQFLKYRIAYDYTNIWKFIEPYQPVSSFLLYPWANFDGVHYLLIAGQGYTNNFGFLPLFPLLIRAVSSLFGTGTTLGVIQFFSGFFLSNLFFLTSLFVLYKLLSLDYSKKTVFLSIIFLLLFPTSFFFGSIYSESLFLLLLLLSFYFARKKQWLWASVFGMMLSVTRIIGIFILLALIYEFIKQACLPAGRKKRVSSKLIPILLIPVGIISYGFYNLNKTGSFFYFLQAHANMGTERSADAIILMPQTLFRYAKILSTLPITQFEWWIALLEVSIFFVASFLLYVAWKKKVRTSYLIFAVLAFLLPASSGTFTGLPRYSLVIFPIFIALALLKNRTLQMLYVLISSILLFILLMFFSKGYFIA
ncbi:MAG: mannosyltransferase family protein [bacterium]|nr:mannosyltransferase family protein [bacterium]